MGFERIDVARARELIAREKARVVDIRDPASYSAGHIAGAEHIDDGNVEEFIQKADLEIPLIVCCYHGNMSQGAAEYFASQGFRRTFSLDGGFAAWQEHEPMG